MEVLEEKEAVYDDGLKTFYSTMPNEDLVNENEENGSSSKTFQRVFFRDKDYVQLNRSTNILIYLFSEAIKEINDTDYTPNNENFKPNEKQTYIINLLKRFKDYVENYKRYSLQELKNKLNQLNNDFLKQLNEETKTLILRKCVSKIYKIRDKVLPKNQDFKKLFETIYPTITDDEADKLNNKIIKPIQNVLDTIKIQQPTQPGLKPLQIKPEKKKLQKIPLNQTSIIKNMAYNKLDDRTIDLFKNAFVGNNIKIDDYCDIDKKNILEFKKMIDDYIHKLDEYNKSKTDADKTFIQGQIMHFKNELTKKYMDLQDINKYINFFINTKRDYDKIIEFYTLSKNKFFEGDALNDVSKLHNDSELLRTFESYRTNYNNYCDEFRKLSTAEQNHIKDNIFNDKKIFEEQITEQELINLKNNEIKAYINFFIDDFKFIYSIINNGVKEEVEEYKPLRIDITNPISKSNLMPNIIKDNPYDGGIEDVEIKQYYYLSLYLQSLIAELNIIHENTNILTPFNEIYNNDINSEFKTILKAFELNETSNYNDLIQYIDELGRECIKKYNTLTGVANDVALESIKDKEIDEELRKIDEQEQKENEELNKRIEEELNSNEELRGIIQKIDAGVKLTPEETKKIKRYYETKFDELKASNPKLKKMSPKMKKYLREEFLKHINELIEQKKKLNDSVDFGFTEDDDFILDEGNPINLEENEGKGLFDKKLFKGGALFDGIKTDNLKEKINIMENFYQKLKNILEEELDIKLNTKLPDLTAILLVNDKEEVKDKKGGMINPDCKKWEGPTGLINKYKGGEIEPIKKTKEKYLPFNPPQKSTKETIEIINQRNQLRNERINNFTRTQIRNTLNSLNNNSLYPSLDNINPEFLKNLAGNGTFLKDQITNHINYIKKKVNKNNFI